MGKRLLIVQNADFEKPGYLLDWARSRGFSTSVCDARETALPAAPGHVILLGAPESVRDLPRPAWLAREADWLKPLLAAETRVLGLCLGAQLVAQLLGGTVTDGAHAEIGWHPFENGAESFPLFQWHKEIFTLPPGAEPIGRSPATPLQGFRFRGRVWALAGHPEVTPGLARDFSRRCWSDDWFAAQAEKRFVQTPAEMERIGEARFEEGRAGVDALLDEWSGA